MLEIEAVAPCFSIRVSFAIAYIVYKINFAGDICPGVL